MTEDKDVSILTKARDDYEKRGSKNPTNTERDKLLKSWRSAIANVDAMRKALEEAEISESAAVQDLAEAYGARPLRIDGVIHTFSSRGNRVFFKIKGTDHIITL